MYLSFRKITLAIIPALMTLALVLATSGILLATHSSDAYAQSRGNNGTDLDVEYVPDTGRSAGRVDRFANGPIYHQPGDPVPTLYIWTSCGGPVHPDFQYRTSWTQAQKCRANVIAAIQQNSREQTAQQELSGYYLAQVARENNERGRIEVACARIARLCGDPR